MKRNKWKIMEGEWEEVREREWVFRIEGEGLLGNMVGGIVGRVVEVGGGKVWVEGLGKVIEEKKGWSGGRWVGGDGVLVVDIGYGDELFGVG